MTDIICDREKCIHNTDGECYKATITIDQEGECEDYEPKRKVGISKVGLEELGFE